LWSFFCSNFYFVCAVPLSAAKIATLLVKTLAKPVSKRIKVEFSRSEPTRRMLIAIGQTTNSITSRMTIWSEGYTVRHIKPLEESVALNKGADFVGESFILLVSAATVIWEYNRTNEKARIKDEQLRAAAKAERDALQANFLSLDARLLALEEVVQYNSQSILNISGKRYKEPANKSELVRISEEDAKQPETEKKGAKKNDVPVTQIQQANPTNDDTEQPSEENPASSTSRPWWKFW
jgi:optic atrophy 3 protein